jgi:ABC-type multidrug transport system fused ATPase/permease subunit
VLATLERLLTFAAAFAWRSPLLSWSLAALALVVVAHRALRLHLRVACTAVGFRRVISVLVSDDDGQDEPGAMAIVEAVHHAARAVVDLATSALADSTATAIGLVVLALSVSDVRVAFLVLAVGVILAVGLLSTRWLARPSDRVFGHYLAMLDAIADASDGRKEIVASGSALDFAQQGRETIETWQKAASSSELRSGLVGRLPGAIVMAAVLGYVLFVGIDADSLRVGIMFAALAPPCVGAVRSAHELSKIASRVSPLAFLSSSPRNASRGTAQAASPTTLEWDTVTFSYGSHVVVADASITARGGEVIALAGANGAGKSTLLAIALGLRAPTHGRFAIDGVDLREMDADAWRRSARYVAQRPYLLPRRDIRTAMKFPSHSVDDETLKAALRRVGLLARLESYSTSPLTTGTDKLSAGERQRLALARIFIEEADAYLLDEPDANLDAAGVKMVAQIVRELADAGKVVVVAAHTPELIAAADKVVHLENGRVISIEERSKDTPTSEKRRAAES